MPMSKSQFARVIRHAHLDFFNEEGDLLGDLNFSYLPNAVSPAEARRVRELLKSKEESDPDSSFVMEILCKAITKWDYRHEEQGPDLPVTPEYMAELGYSIHTQLLDAIHEANKVPPTKSQRSAPGSGATLPATSQTPEPPSTSPATGGSLTPVY